MSLKNLLSSIRFEEAEIRAKQADVDEKWVIFGRTIRREREARGISLKALSIDIGRTSQMVCMMEKWGRRWPNGIAEKAVKALARPEQWPDAGKLP